MGPKGTKVNEKSPVQTDVRDGAGEVVLLLLLVLFFYLKWEGSNGANMSQFVERKAEVQENISLKSIYLLCKLGRGVLG